MKAATKQKWQGRWDQLTGKARKLWGGLTDNDFQSVKGDYEQLIGKIKERSGQTREEIENALDSDYRIRRFGLRSPPSPIIRLGRRTLSRERPSKTTGRSRAERGLPRVYWATACGGPRFTRLARTNWIAARLQAGPCSIYSLQRRESCLSRRCCLFRLGGAGFQPAARQASLPRGCTVHVRPGGWKPAHGYLHVRAAQTAVEASTRRRLQQRLQTLVKDAPIPVFWLFGKTQSGKTCIIKFLTGAEDAEIGHGFRPCTRFSREYEFPHRRGAAARLPRHPRPRRAGYDPAEDLARFDARPTLIVTVRLARSRRRTPDRASAHHPRQPAGPARRPRAHLPARGLSAAAAPAAVSRSRAGPECRDATPAAT